MKRKDLVVGETYYVNHKKGAYAGVFGYGGITSHGQYGVKVLAVEPYEYRGYGERHFKVSSGNGVLVEVTEFYTNFDKDEKPFRATRTFQSVIPLSRIIAPWDIAVKQIQANAEVAKERTRKRDEERAVRERFEANVFGPAINDLSRALVHLQQRVDGTPKHYDRDTRLGSMPLDVIETLTTIINEALAEKEEVNA